MTSQPDPISEHLQQQLNEALHVYSAMSHDLNIFLEGAARWFSGHPSLTVGNPPVVHSVKARLKNSGHLSTKLCRKYLVDGELRFTPADLGKHVTDLAGLRVMHLHQDQFGDVHRAIMEKVEEGDWFLNEPVKAYTWDPESRTYFETFGLDCHLKESHYTSVHYIIRPRVGSKLACEIQVRTLFEEIWGEVDHSLNYPDKTLNTSCREQLRVLAKLVGAGSRLVESIFKTEGVRVIDSSTQL